MTLDEILKAEIPEGIYSWTLDYIQHELGRSSGIKKIQSDALTPLGESFCAAFSALMGLALLSDEGGDSQGIQIRRMLIAKGRHDTLAEVHKIVDEMIKDQRNLSPDERIGDGSIDTLEFIESKLSELGRGK